MPQHSRKTWVDVFPQELEVVKERHTGAEPVEQNLVGLALSGGGIRSATFALGVLEGLKRYGLLGKIDYLSTVSGGGYIGAWLSANCKRAAERGDDWLNPTADWDDSIAHLRRYSNYLSPVLGFFSADTWSMGMIWLRNMSLVQLTVILAIAVTLIPPRLLFAAFGKWPEVGDYRWTTIILFILAVVGVAGNQLRISRRGAVGFLEARNWRKGLGLALAVLGVALGWALYLKFDPFAPGPVNHYAAIPVALLLVIGGFLLQPAAVKLVNILWRGKKPPDQINYTQAWAQGVIIVPMLATGFLVAAILWGQSQPGTGRLAEIDTFSAFFLAAWKYWPFPLTVVFSSLWVLSFCSVGNWRSRADVIVACMAPFPAMLTLHALLSAIMLVLHAWLAMGEEGRWLAYIWTPAMVLYTFSVTIVILIGMLGRQSSEGVREWWSRLGAWLAIYGVGWMMINVAACYGPLLSAVLANADTWKGMSLSGGWIGTTLAGLFAGRSATTGRRDEKGTLAMALEGIAAIAPFVFIAGLLVIISTALHLLIASASASTWFGVAGLESSHWRLLSDSDLKVTLLCLAACGATVALLAARVDINEFSLNAFYRNRLIRCYLGATRFHPGERHPQNFTGFDDKDDMKLAALAAASPPAGPLHIVNCALNLGGSSDLALHTRHSSVFTLTPLQCGSRYLSRDRSGNKKEIGYIPTSVFGGTGGQPTLGQAISVSGAAASPNRGYHTSHVVAFLLTLFNVRLGWWFPNPSKTGTENESPWFSLRYLITELFGEADDKSKYLAISDGGHFENMAAYELVKRKCRVIVIADAECDPDYEFEGLGTLIRMCEVDFNITISIDVGSIRTPPGHPWSKGRCAVGSIDYGAGSAPGTLIYLKASMTGREDTSILQYKAAHREFPHESTGDQFYGEDQFESYRLLGRDIAMTAFAPVAAESDWSAARCPSV